MRIARGRFALALAGTLMSTPAYADTLREALLKAYETNPTLEAARAQQRANDENVPIQRASGLPSVTSSAQHIEFIRNSGNSPTAPSRNLQAGVNLNVPIYSGGAVKNSVRAAEERVAAGQADLRATESAIFSQVVAAYMDVIRNEALVALNTNQVEVLAVNVEATNDRYEIGILTRTDVAQSRSRLAIARGDLRSAQANLLNARETYIELVGNPPGVLLPPPPLPGFPSNPNEAVAIALENNPDLIGARERAEAADYDIAVAGAGRKPQVSFFTRGDYQDYFGTLGGAASSDVTQREVTANAGISVSFPLYQGGRVAAQQRQAQARSSAALDQVIATERDVIAQVRSSYSSWLAANAIIISSQSAVEAAELSLEGVRAENSIGNRTILDVLNAEQELLTARVQLVTARRNAYVAGFSLLAAMGKAEARDLGLTEAGLLYDPNVNYTRVRGIIWDWQRDPDPVSGSTRTIDIPPADAEIVNMEIVGSGSPDNN